MALSFHLVKRPDMRKDAAEGSKLFYAQVRSLKKLDFNKLCDLIAVRSTAFIGDVMLVIEGLLSVMEERLEEGDVIQMGRPGQLPYGCRQQGYCKRKGLQCLPSSTRLVSSSHYGHHAQRDPQECQI